ncbi:MAG TPA: hypothetical protein VN718_03945 [Rhizomicrobium sp.]|nr:hypothetical protein [Rhizomicrobium sp.]
MPPAPSSVTSGKKYLSIRCNGLGCNNMLVYAELPDKVDADTQDRLERHHHGKSLNCPNCGQLTRIYEGMTVYIR